MNKKYLTVMTIIIIIFAFTVAFCLDGRNLRILSSLTNIENLVIRNNIAIFHLNDTPNDIENLLNTNVSVLDGETEITKYSYIKTNETLVIGNSSYPIAVLGDVKADGIINIQDAAKAYKALSPKHDHSSFTLAEIEALDSNNDGLKNGSDIIKICNRIGEVDTGSISLNKSNLLLQPNQTETLIATVSEGIEVTWTSSDETIATVNQNGLVTGINPGTATIIAETSTGKVAYCTVKITINETSIELNKTSLKVQLNNTRRLEATVLPENATTNITWSSSDETVATVDAAGTVRGISLGTATITATTTNGLTATCDIEVVVWEDSISIVRKNGEDLTEISMYEDRVATAYVVASPENAYFEPVSWSSSDETVATVNQNGEITSISGGTAVITATSLHGKIDTINVTVKVMETVSLNKKSLTMNEGDNKTLVATVTPENATHKSVTWSSSNTNVATVDATGKVVAIGAGTATITATTTNSSDTCTVTVRETYVIDDLKEGLSQNKAEFNTERINEHLKIVANSDDYQKVKITEGSYYFYIDIDTAISIAQYKENKVVHRMDNIYLDLNNSEIKMYGTMNNRNSDYRYYIFKIDNVSNVSIKNGTIIGDRLTHDYSVEHPGADTLNSHEWGMGINIKDSNNVVIKNLEIEETTGDGIRIQDGMNFDTDSCSEINNTSKIYVRNNKIHDVRRDGITIIAGSNIELTGNKIYNIGNSYIHADGTEHFGTNPKAGINLERNKSESCTYIEESDPNKTKTQIEEFIRNVTISDNKIYNNANKDITFLNGIYNMEIKDNEFEKQIHTNNSYVFCDAPNGGVYEGVNRCYYGDNIHFYSESEIKNNFEFTITGNIGTSNINSLEIIKDSGLSPGTGYNNDQICCKSFRGNNNCRKQGNTSQPMTCNNQ